MEIMPIEVLLVEDNPVDVRFTHEAFRAIHPSIHFHVVSDGVEAMAFLRHEGAHLLAPALSCSISTSPRWVAGRF
jgi:CheY-like chemotaxis protein